VRLTASPLPRNVQYSTHSTGWPWLCKFALTSGHKTVVVDGVISHTTDHASLLLQVPGGRAPALPCRVRLAWLPAPDVGTEAAGVAWRTAGRPGPALALLNRFLDVVEAMDGEDDGAPMPNAAFGAAADVPVEFDLPQRHYTSEASRKEVRHMQLQAWFSCRFQYAEFMPLRDASLPA